MDSTKSFSLSLSLSLSLTIRLYHSLLPARLPGYIQCPYRAFIDTLELVTLHMSVHVKGNVAY